MEEVKFISHEQGYEYKDAIIKQVGLEAFEVYEIPNYGGKPQFEGLTKTMEEAKSLIDSFF